MRFTPGWPTCAAATRQRPCPWYGRSQRLQARIDAFRIRAEVLKATYTAARTELLMDEVTLGGRLEIVADFSGDRVRLR